VVAKETSVLSMKSWCSIWQEQQITYLCSKIVLFYLASDYSVQTLLCCSSK